MKNSAVFERLFSQCASSQFEMFPTSVFQVLLSSYKTAKNPIVPSEKRAKSSHAHTFTLALSICAANGAEGFSFTISHPKLSN